MMPKVLSKDEWKRIKQWTKGCSEEEEASRAATVRQVEYVEKLNRESKEMTKKWPNSIENVNKRNQEIRELRQKRSEELNRKFYEDYLQQQVENQKKLMEQARIRVFQEQDGPKTLLSSLMTAEAQREWNAAREFNAKLKEEEDMEEREYAEFVKNDSRKFHEEEGAKKKTIRDNNMKQRAFLEEQIKENSKKRNSDYAETMYYECVENTKCDLELKRMKEMEEKAKAAEKKRIIDDMDSALLARRRRLLEDEIIDSLDDRMEEIYLEFKHRVDCRSKKTEGESRTEKLRILENISKGLASNQAEKAAKEEEIIKKVQAEYEEKLKAREESDKQKAQKIRQERIEERAKFLEKQAVELNKEKTLEKWEIMNKLKEEESYKNFKNVEEERMRQQKKKYRQDLLDLWKERNDREEQESAALRKFYGEEAENKLRIGDKKILEYGENLLKEADQVGRPKFAIQRAIRDYKKYRRLFKPPNIADSMQEHFEGYKPEDKTDHKTMQPYVAPKWRANGLRRRPSVPEQPKPTWRDRLPKDQINSRDGVNNKVITIKLLQPTNFEIDCKEIDLKPRTSSNASGQPKSCG